LAACVRCNVSSRPHELTQADCGRPRSLTPSREEAERVEGRTVGVDGLEPGLELLAVGTLELDLDDGVARDEAAVLEVLEEVGDLPAVGRVAEEDDEARGVELGGAVVARDGVEGGRHGGAEVERARRTRWSEARGARSRPSRGEVRSSRERGGSTRSSWRGVLELERRSHGGRWRWGRRRAEWRGSRRAQGWSWRVGLVGVRYMLQGMVRLGQPEPGESEGRLISSRRRADEGGKPTTPLGRLQKGRTC